MLYVSMHGVCVCLSSQKKYFFLLQYNTELDNARNFISQFHSSIVGVHDIHPSAKLDSVAKLQTRRYFPAVTVYMHCYKEEGTNATPNMYNM